MFTSLEDLSVQSAHSSVKSASTGEDFGLLKIWHRFPLIFDRYCVNLEIIGEFNLAVFTRTVNTRVSD